MYSIITMPENYINITSLIIRIPVSDTGLYSFYQQAVNLPQPPFIQINFVFMIPGFLPYSRGTLHPGIFNPLEPLRIS
jgi:hypothetical protein